MMTKFNSRNDVRRYANDQLENYDATQYGCTHDELIERLVDLIVNLPDFEYGSDMNEILDTEFNRSGNWELE